MIRAANLSPVRSSRSRLPCCEISINSTPLSSYKRHNLKGSSLAIVWFGWSWNGTCMLKSGFLFQDVNIASLDAWLVACGVTVEMSTSNSSYVEPICVALQIKYRWAGRRTTLCDKLQLSDWNIWVKIDALYIYLLWWGRLESGNLMSLYRGWIKQTRQTVVYIIFGHSKRKYQYITTTLSARINNSTICTFIHIYTNICMVSRKSKSCIYLS